MITDNQEPFCHALAIGSVLAFLSEGRLDYRLGIAPDSGRGPAAPKDITVAVTDFENRSGANIPDIGPAGRDITTSFISNLPGVRVVTRDRLAALNREIQLHGVRGYPQKVAELADFLGADALVTGSVNRYDVERRTFKGYNTSAHVDTYRMTMTLQVIDIKSAEVIFSKTFDTEKKSTYAQATSAPSRPLDRESELLAVLLEDQAKEEVQNTLRQIAAGLGKAKLLAVPIVSDPDGAEVVINGIVQGNTPLTVNLVMGVHEVEITKRGYAPWRHRVKVVPDFRLDVHLAPEAPDGR